MNPYDAKNSEPNFWLSCMLIDPEAMCHQVRGEQEALYITEPGKSYLTEILETLAFYNAEGRHIWKPMHMQPIYRMNGFVTREGNGRAKTNVYIRGGALGKDGKPLGVEMDIFRRGLCLPSDNKMTVEVQERIIEMVKGCFQSDMERGKKLLSAAVLAIVSGNAVFTLSGRYRKSKEEKASKQQIKTQAHKQGFYERYIKRPQNFCCALVVLIVLSPVMAVTALLVRLKLGAPVIFKQERPGLSRKIFTQYKFRTMTDDKDEKGNLLPDDVRLTKFGKLIRPTSLDGKVIKRQTLKTLILQGFRRFCPTEIFPQIAPFWP